MAGRKSLHRVYLSIGSNLGNRTENLEQSVSLVEQAIGPARQMSAVYESEAWGFLSENRFYNMCMEVETTLPPYEVMHHLLQIEDRMGRERSADGYQDRTIDLDLLFYDDLVMDTPDLVLPHPGIPERRFVLVPLAEIAQGFIHPVLNISVAELLEKCPDPGDIEPV